jgi:CheY-like chemotaxis protein
VKLRTPLASIFESQNTELKAARWMVVEDNADVLDFMTLSLEGLGRADVYKFRTGEEALNCFALYPDEFELVITDYGLPGLNGVELCRRVRDFSPTVKTILSTGNAIAPEPFAKQVGFSGVLQKPFTVDELWRVVKSVLPAQES